MAGSITLRRRADVRGAGQATGRWNHNPFPFGGGDFTLTVQHNLGKQRTTISPGNTPDAARARILSGEVATIFFRDDSSDNVTAAASNVAALGGGVSSAPAPAVSGVQTSRRSGSFRFTNDQTPTRRRPWNSAGGTISPEFNAAIYHHRLAA